MMDEIKVYPFLAEDEYDLNENNDTTENMLKFDIKYNVNGNNLINLINNIKLKDKNQVYKNEAVADKGEIVTMQLITENRQKSYKMEDVSAFARLPFVGNKSIKDKTTLIGEEGKETSAQFIGNIKVFTDSRIVPSKYYEIGYSSDELADFNSEYVYIEEKESYTEEELQVINNAKTINIKFNNNNVLGDKITIEYDVKLPEDAQDGLKAGQQFCIQYNINSNSQILESTPGYAEVGKKYTSLEIEKIFEGTNPSVSKKDIEFEVIGIDNNNRYTAKTNENGIANIETIEAGLYEVVEKTEFDDYIANSTAAFEATIFGGNKKVTIKNNIKTGNVTVRKHWEDGKGNEVKQEKEATLQIYGTTVSGDVWQYSKETKDSVVTFENVPYGTFKIKESNNITGWKLKEEIDVIVDKDNNAKEVDVTNEIIHIDGLRINKTVPNGDTVAGIKFRIYGFAYANYTDNNGNFVQVKVDEIVTIGEDGTGYLENVPAGVYTIEEIEIPQIETEKGQETKYIPVKKTIIINGDNKTEVINIENRWKTGDINIKVTATEGADLSRFKVKITGQTYYGTNIQEEYNVPESGNINIKSLPIGKYKIEECNTKEVDGKIITTSPDGYEVTYNPEDVHTNGIEIEYKKTASITIHNEYIGKGKVKIIKKLEYEEDVSKAEGIKFKIKGKDDIGKDVEEIITIGKDGTGTSNEIPVGTYLLSEIEETVPENYMVCEEQEITVSTSNTSENPLELNIVNKLAKRKYNNGN